MRFLFAVFLTVFLWTAAPAAAAIDNWETIVSDAATTLSSPDEGVTEEALTDTRKALKSVRSEAGDLSRLAGNEKERLQTLLGTLGDAPDEESEVKEADTVIEKRKELNDAIRVQDAKVKQASLAMTRANELLDALVQLEQARQRERMLRRQADWYSADYAVALLAGVGDTLFFVKSTPVLTFFGNIIRYTLTLFIMSAVALLIFTSAKNRLNTTGAIATGIYKKRLLVYSVCSTALMLLHYQSAAVLAPEVRILATAGNAVAAALCGLMSIYGITLSETANFSRFWRRVLKLTRGLLIVSIPAAVAGYVYLATYINLMVFSAYFGLCAFVSLRGILDHYARSSTKQGEPSAKGLSPLGIALAEPLLAFLCLQIPLFFAGFHPEDVLDWFSRYQEGFNIGSIRFYPTDIIIGLVMFFGLIFLFKTIQWFLSGRVFPHTGLDAGVKNAAISLVGYAGMLFAVISLLSALGINTSNLAIVAGALSVGIGFGLQAIISNFVSGLILLFERPVRVGDWVNVGGTEGYVRKINVRSTRIETFKRADILVPNSRFITEAVCNWTLHSASGRIEVPVGVAYGSDTEQVRDILLKVAKEHPEALNYPAPDVLFTAFGDSSLNFEVRFHIKDITARLVVASDVHYAIDKAFREASIEIPFPQRDVHVRDVPSPAADEKIAPLNDSA